MKEKKYTVKELRRMIEDFCGECYGCENKRCTLDIFFDWVEDKPIKIEDFRE